MRYHLQPLLFFPPRVTPHDRSAKEFEEYGRMIAAKYLVAHSRTPHYKALLKAVLKAALAPLPVQVCPDLLYT